MEVKLDDPMKSIDSMLNMVMGWAWWLMKWMWPVIILCLMLGGVKEMLAIGEWVPDVGAPQYWLYAAGCYALILWSGKK